MSRQSGTYGGLGLRKTEGVKQQSAIILEIGVVFGNVEEEYNGEVKMRRRIRWFCKWDAVANASVPQDKLLPGSSAPASTGTASTDGFVNSVPGDEEEIPF